MVVLLNLVARDECETLLAEWTHEWETLRAHAEPVAAMYEGRYSGVAPRFAELAPRGQRRV